MGYDIGIRYRILYRILYRYTMHVACVMYLWILVLETVSLNVKVITSLLQPSIEHVALPLDAAKRVKMAA
jgi:hypothetical protein